MLVRLSNGIVAETFDHDDTLAERFHPDLLAELFEAPDDTVVGQVQTEDGFKPETEAVFVGGGDGGPLWRSITGAEKLGSRKAVLAAAVDAKRDELIAGGYQHNFGGSAGIRTLDNRNEADAINWLGLKGIVDTLIMTDQGDEMVGMVAADNTVFEASATTISAALVAMAVWRSKLVLRARALKNAVTGAKNDAALDKIDLEAGWSA